MKKNIAKLSPEEKEIILNKGTESPFSGKYNDFYEAGVFVCRACASPLYEANTKFDAECGWPSFDDEISGAIKRIPDYSGGKIRTEICCSFCDGHLGHVFLGEQITKKNTRHCVNSLSICFRPYKQLSQATFGAGCFWSIQQVFKNVTGVYLAQAGYMGGDSQNPTYEEICKGLTNHTEVINIYFDKVKIKYTELLDIFWENHNSTKLREKDLENKIQYRSVIFYYNQEQKLIAEASKKTQKEKIEKNIITDICAAKIFFRAEEYHQNYLDKNNLANCSF